MGARPSSFKAAVEEHQTRESLVSPSKKVIFSWFQHRASRTPMLEAGRSAHLIVDALAGVGKTHHSDQEGVNRAPDEYDPDLWPSVARLPMN